MRREFTEPVKREIRERSGGVCENQLMPPDILHLFPNGCQNEPSEIDHVFADTLEGEKSEPLTADDGAHLCFRCHKIKTRDDQSKRKTQNKMRPRKGRPKTGWFRNSHGKKIPSRSFDRRAIPGSGWPSKKKAKAKRGRSIAGKGRTPFR